MGKSNKIITVFEDDDLIILSKPAHVLSVPDRYDVNIPNLYHYLKRKHEKVFIVHRLDGETSGIICFAKNEAAHKHLSKQFQERSVRKVYCALIDGKPMDAEGTIDLPIAEVSSRRGQMRIDKGKGKQALTTYKVTKQFRHFAVVEVQIHTGRTHQIRVHFQAIGHPLAVDKTYGQRDAFYLSEVKRYYKLKKFEEERPIINRVSLHAHQLFLIHPTTSETVHFTAPLPKDLAVAIKQLEKCDS